MKRHLSIWFLLLGLAAILIPFRAVAQDDDVVSLVTDQMNSYLKELNKYNEQIVTADDAERLENRCKNLNKMVESMYSDYTDFFRYDKKLYGIYEDYTDLYQQVCKRIDELKEGKAKQERVDKLTTKLNRYLEQLQELEEAGTRCASNKRIDSLNLIKKQAEECYVDEATIDYGANRDFIDENVELTQLWKKVKDTYSRINALEIVKSPIDLTMILEIVGIIAALVIIVNMISAKIKAAKALKPKKEPKEKKKEPELPSI